MNLAVGDKFLVTSASHCFLEGGIMEIINIYKDKVYYKYLTCPDPKQLREFWQDASTFENAFWEKVLLRLTVYKNEKKSEYRRIVL